MSATTGAGDTGSSSGVEADVFEVEWSIGKGKIEVGFDPRGYMFGGQRQQLGIAVSPGSSANI